MSADMLSAVFFILNRSGAFFFGLVKGGFVMIKFI